METSQKILVVAIAGLSLGACSSVDEKNTFMAYNDLQDKVIAHDEQWQAIQPKLDRIDALEAELAALKQGNAGDMEEVKPKENLVSDQSMAAVNVAPAVTPTSETDDTGMTTSVAMESSAAPVVSAPVASAPVATSKSEYGVQVAAYLKKEDAITGWQAMQKKSPTSFQGLTPLINEKEVNGRMMYQVKVGPFNSKSFSSDFCMMLKEKGGDCLLTQYNGQTFSVN
ncbi:sporulation related protein [Marinomonas alcarazii]|uniref:Sporulation related protein n=1 Tax=Marinomonas alcarazii TaxID=491949 RepID=A0A318V777_9GAMM|nr:SPOR domain-containing protein [Marinomonas alcarazii]PYF83457.1 sporulation related protein [Marinomonas alcarazii]